jgi:hypothetical protein
MPEHFGHPQLKDAPPECSALSYRYRPSTVCLHVEFVFVDRKRTIPTYGVALIGTLSGFGLCAVVLAVSQASAWGPESRTAV